MGRKLFTEGQQQLLRQNPYIYSVTETRITLTKEFKELFMTVYKAGESPRKILEDHGFDISIIDERRMHIEHFPAYPYRIQKVWGIP